MQQNCRGREVRPCAEQAAAVRLLLCTTRDRSLGAAPCSSHHQISCQLTDWLAGAADIDDLVRQRQAAHIALFCEAQKAMQAGTEAQEALQQLLKTWVQKGGLRCMSPRCTLLTCLLCLLAPGVLPYAEHSPRRVSSQLCSCQAGRACSAEQCLSSTLPRFTLANKNKRPHIVSAVSST